MPIVILILRHIVKRLFEVLHCLLLQSDRFNLLRVQLLYIDCVVFVTALLQQDSDIVIILAEHFSSSPRLSCLILLLPLNAFWKRLESALLALFLVFNVFDQLVFNCKLFHIFLCLFLGRAFSQQILLERHVI